MSMSQAILAFSKQGCEGELVSRLRAIGFALLVVSLLAAMTSMATRFFAGGPDASTAPGWTTFFVIALLGAVGMVLVWVGRPAYAPAVVNDPSATLDATGEALADIVAVLEDINSNSESIDLDELVARMDTSLNGEVTKLGQHSDELLTAMGEAAYGIFMTRFALGEDHLARTRQAAGDGDLDSAWDSMAGAEEMMTEALTTLRNGSR